MASLGGSSIFRGFNYLFVSLPMKLQDQWGSLQQNFRKDVWWAGIERIFFFQFSNFCHVNFNETCLVHVYRFKLFTVKRSINQEQQYDNFAQQCHNTEHSTSSLVMQPLYYNKSKHTTCANRYVH